jgi:hypothetical protein
MISLTGGNVQNLAGVAVPGGSLTLQLNSDAVVIATPGFVPSAYQRTFPFDSTGNLAGSCKLWSNFELNPPGTQYLVTFKDANGSRISNQIWQFTQSSGASVDIGTIIPVAPASSAASLPFSSVLANLLFGGPASGAAAFPSFRSLVAADIPALLNALQQFGATDTGLSRLSAHVLGVGNGTQGDVSGSIEAAIMLMSVIQQITGTTLVIKDSNNGTRFSIPLNGTAQGTLNNTLITGASTYGGTTLNFQKFLANGTFTIPANVTSVKVTVVGGGGAGGGSTAANNGGGGGSGGVAIKFLTGLTPGNTIAVTVGAGGTGVSTATGNAGSASAIASGTQTITTVTANGGNGGITIGAISAGGAGAAVSTNGDINGAGNAGGSAPGSNLSGGGGPSFLGGSGNPGNGSAGNPAVANTGSGGGGAGAAGNAAGGTGGSGIVIFEWTT